MQRRNLSVLFAAVLCSLLVQAQDVPPPETMESDPLDVLEPQVQEKAEQPTVPEFQEVPEPEILTQDLPPVPEPQEIAEPTAPALSEPSISQSPPPLQTSEVPKLQGPVDSSLSSDPDFKKESRFHSIYKKYNEQPTSVESWEKAVGDRKSETYKVQKGDTLWDISNTFFADSQYWPKVWSLNKESITNPHQISPDMNIQFFPGTMNDAPTVGLAQQGAGTQSPSGEGAVVPAAPPEIKLPEAKRPDRPATDIPESLPLYRMGGVNKPAESIILELPKTSFPKPVEYISYFISDDPIKGAGKVTETEMGLKAAGEFQYIYVEINDETPAKQYVVQRNAGEIKDPEVKNRKGFLVENQGEIEVLEKVSDGQNIYRAIVKKTIEHIEVGSILIPGKLPMVDVSPSSVVSGVGAKIIGGQFSNQRVMYGSNSIVFLNAGANQGLQDGQTLKVYADQSLRNKKTKAVLNDRPIGSLKVIRVTANFATAYILAADDNVLTGDYVGRKDNHASLREVTAPIINPEAETPIDSELDFVDESPDQPVPEANEVTPDFGDDSSELNPEVVPEDGNLEDELEL